MITGAILDFVNSILLTMYGWIPASWDPPGWVTGSMTAVTGLFANASSMGTWIPLDFAFLCGQAIMTTYIGGGVVKAFRILVSQFTGGGGSAG